MWEQKDWRAGLGVSVEDAGGGVGSLSVLRACFADGGGGGGESSLGGLLNLLQSLESNVVCRPFSTERYLMFFLRSLRRTRLLFVGGT